MPVIARARHPLAECGIEDRRRAMRDIREAFGKVEWRIEHEDFTPHGRGNLLEGVLAVIIGFQRKKSVRGTTKYR